MVVGGTNIILHRVVREGFETGYSMRSVRDFLPPPDSSHLGYREFIGNLSYSPVGRSVNKPWFSVWFINDSSGLSLHPDFVETPDDDSPSLFRPVPPLLFFYQNVGDPDSPGKADPRV